MGHGWINKIIDIILHPDKSTISIDQRDYISIIHDTVITDEADAVRFTTFIKTMCI